MAYSASNTYATVEQLKSWVTRYGYEWGSDVDSGDGYVDSAEEVYAESALEYANVRIDEALTPHVDVSPRPANDWCKDRCIDIAAARFWGAGGREVPKTIADAAIDAAERLDLVRENSLKVPNLDYSQTLDNGSRGGRMAAAINYRC